jgi:hypothetical protein
MKRRRSLYRKRLRLLYEKRLGLLFEERLVLRLNNCWILMIEAWGASWHRRARVRVWWADIVGQE